MQASSPAPQVGIGWRHPHYAELLQTLPAIDFLEVHSENFFAAGGAALAVLERGRQHYPVSLHGVGLSLGSAVGLDPWHLDALATLVQRIDPVRVSDHAAFARGIWGYGMVHASDLLPLPFSHEALQVLCDNVQRVQDRLGRQLLVENLSAYVQWTLPAHEQVLAEPEFLSELAQRTGCGLLVDVNNIYVNARNATAQDGDTDLLAECRRWLRAIASSAVAELHVAGHCEVSDAYGSLVIDDHGSRVRDAVWQLHRDALELWGPVPTLVEWDTAVPTLDVLLGEAQCARANTPALELA